MCKPFPKAGASPSHCPSEAKQDPTLCCIIFFFFNWRLITLQYCGGFCHTFTRVLRLGTREAQPSSHSPSGSKYSAGQLGIPHAAPQRQVSAVWASDQSWGSSRDLLLNGSPGWGRRGAEAEMWPRPQKRHVERGWGKLLCREVPAPQLPSSQTVLCLPCPGSYPSSPASWSWEADHLKASIHRLSTRGQPRVRARLCPSWELPGSSGSGPWWELPDGGE